MWAAYTRGRGRLSCEVAGYFPCHNTEAVVAALAYDPAADLENTPDSVFCSHGAGITIPWDQVEENMHLESVLRPKPAAAPAAAPRVRTQNLDLDEKERSASSSGNSARRRHRCTGRPPPRPRPPSPCRPAGKNTSS